MTQPSPLPVAGGLSVEVPMVEADRPLPGGPAAGRPARSRAPLPPGYAAAVPYRIHDGEAEILLVTSRRRGRWIVPKGVVMSGTTPAETAGLEAFEEGGVEGTVRPEPVGRYHHGRRAPVVELYLLHVEGESAEWPEREERARRWVPASAAEAQVGVAGLRPLLRRVASALDVPGPR